jgi:transcriptional regulator with XRE-family HTH domain/uncharacterized cupin superfamily protein
MFLHSSLHNRKQDMPVYSSHLVDYRGFAVPARIREERQQRGLTLRALANQVGFSAAQLSNIETGKTVLDLAELSAIAAALNVPIASLFPEGTEFHYLIKRHTDLAHEPPRARELTGPEPGPATHHNPVWSLAEAFVGKHIEPVLAQIHPLPDRDLHYIGHDHEEFMFVLKGEVESLLKTNDGLVTERLQPGDCLYFRSYLPHCHRSLGPEPAETLNVICSLRGPIDSEGPELGPAGHQFYRRGVYTDVVKEAAEKIGLLRRSRGLTLAQLAANIGVSTRQLADIERGLVAPDVEILLRLARMFRRPVEYFVATTLESRPSHFVQRRSEVRQGSPRLRKTADASHQHAHTFRPLAHGFPDRGMHPYYVEIKASSPSPDDRKFETHHGQEFVFVLDGDIEFVTQLGEQLVTEVLRPGDSLFLESGVPHVLRAHGLNPYADIAAQIITVFWSPLGEDYLFQ